jgi:hypothetical protein
LAAGGSNQASLGAGACLKTACHTRFGASGMLQTLLADLLKFARVQVGWEEC